MRPVRLATLPLFAALVTACGAPPPSVAPPVSTTDFRISLTSRDKSDVSAAMDVLEARLRTLGIGNFSGAAGDSIVFTLPSAGLPDRRVLDDVLHRPGVVALLPWPADGPAPIEGDAVPAGARSLIDPATGIRSADVVDANGTRAVKVVLEPEAAASVAEYTSLHVQGYMPLALDGRILIAPTIQGPITGGELLIELAADGPDPSALAAILDSGPLPEGVIGR